MWNGSIFRHESSINKLKSGETGTDCGAKCYAKAAALLKRKIVESPNYDFRNVLFGFRTYNFIVKLEKAVLCQQTTKAFCQTL